jgi:hypothetical protein
MGRDEDITHPHVQDGQLCEGEGRSAVQAALAECRLHDFFMLVSQLLQTYGQGSAYVELKNWYGTPCQDCGSYVDEDERDYCGRCDRILCGSCSITCRGCDESRCGNCIRTCAACDGDYCISCLETCPKCHEQFCEDCLDAGMCHECREKQRTEETKNDPTQSVTIEQPAVARSKRSRQRKHACATA